MESNYYYSSDDEIAVGPVTINEIRRDLTVKKNANIEKRQTFGSFTSVLDSSSELKRLPRKEDLKSVMASKETTFNNEYFTASDTDTSNVGVKCDTSQSDYNTAFNTLNNSVASSAKDMQQQQPVYTKLSETIVISSDDEDDENPIQQDLDQIIEILEEDILNDERNDEIKNNGLDTINRIIDNADTSAYQISKFMEDDYLDVNATSAFNFNKKHDQSIFKFNPNIKTKSKFEGFKLNLSTNKINDNKIEEETSSSELEENSKEIIKDSEFETLEESSNNQSEIDNHLPEDQDEEKSECRFKNNENEEVNASSIYEKDSLLDDSVNKDNSGMFNDTLQEMEYFLHGAKAEESILTKEKEDALLQTTCSSNTSKLQENSFVSHNENNRLPEKTNHYRNDYYEDSISSNDHNLVEELESNSSHQNYILKEGTSHNNYVLQENNYVLSQERNSSSHNNYVLLQESNSSHNKFVLSQKSNSSHNNYVLLQESNSSHDDYVLQESNSSHNNYVLQESNSLHNNYVLQDYNYGSKESSSSSSSHDYLLKDNDKVANKFSSEIAKFKTPLKQAPRSVTKSRTNFKDVISPIGFYIKNSPSVPLKRNVSAKKVPLCVVEGGKSQSSKKENIPCEIPAIVYKPSKKTVVTSKSSLNLPGKIQKLVPQSPCIIKHTERIQKTPKSTSVQNKLAYLQNDVTVEESILNSTQDVSVVSIKKAYIS